MSAITAFGSDRAAFAPGTARAAWRLLLVVFGAIPALDAITSDRLFRGPPRISGASLSDTWLLLAGLAAAVVVVFLALPVVRPAPAPVWLAVVAFFTAPALSAYAHGQPIGTSALAAVLTFSAVAILPTPPVSWLTRAITSTLATYAIGSLIAALVTPEWAVQQQFEFSVLPGIHSRLHGLTSHANALGPMMVALLLLELRRKRKRPLVCGAALVALLWTQSKTSWAALALIAGVEALRYFRSRARRPVVPVLIVLSAMVLSVGLAIGVASGPQVDPRDNSVETLTGRTAVWQVTLEVWRQDWLLGYGPSLWDSAMDARYDDRVGFAPGHAHNQLIQTLGISGAVGAVALLAYLFALGTLARRGDPVTRGGTTVLLAVLLLRGVTEVSLPLSVVGADFLLHLLAFWYVATAANSADQSVRVPSQHRQ